MSGTILYPTPRSEPLPRISTGLASSIDSWIDARAGTEQADAKPEEEEELAEARDLEAAMAAVLSELPEQEMRLAAREAELAARKQAARDAQVCVSLNQERCTSKHGRA